MSEPALIDGRPAQPGAFELFLTFAQISVYGFGGVMAWSFRVLVEEKRWLTAAEFNELLALSQFLPGPNIVNLSVVFGSRLCGIPGAAASLLGLIGAPFVLVTILAFLYSMYGDLDALRRILSGVAAAAAGFIVAVVAKMAAPIFRKPFGVGPVFAIATFVAIGVLRWPLVWVLLVLAPVSVVTAYWIQRR